MSNEPTGRTIVARERVYTDGTATRYDMLEYGIVVAYATMRQDGTETYMVQRSKDGLVLAGCVSKDWLWDWMHQPTKEA